jgi:hypothetical protein
MRSRRLLEQHQLGRALFESINAVLRQKGLLLYGSLRTLQDVGSFACANRTSCRLAGQLSCNDHVEPRLFDRGGTGRSGATLFGWRRFRLSGLILLRTRCVRLPDSDVAADQIHALDLATESDRALLFIHIPDLTVP